MKMNKSLVSTLNNISYSLTCLTVAHHFDPMDTPTDEANHDPQRFEYTSSTSWSHAECISVKLFKTAVTSNVSREAYNSLVKIFNEFLEVVQTGKCNLQL
jgi:hypothetical protein